MTIARKINGEWLIADSITLDRYDFEGSAESIKASIDDVVNRARMMGMVDDGRFNIWNASGGYDGDNSVEINYYFDRKETDVERSDREAEAAYQKKQKALKKKLQSDSEYEEFVRLKAKFGDLK